MSHGTYGSAMYPDGQIVSFRFEWWREGEWFIGHVHALDVTVCVRDVGVLEETLREEIAGTLRSDIQLVDLHTMGPRP